MTRALSALAFVLAFLCTSLALAYPALSNDTAIELNNAVGLRLDTMRAMAPCSIDGWGAGVLTSDVLLEFTETDEFNVDHHYVVRWPAGSRGVMRLADGIFLDSASFPMIEPMSFADRLVTSYLDDIIANGATGGIYGGPSGWAAFQLGGTVISEGAEWVAGWPILLYVNDAQLLEGSGALDDGVGDGECGLYACPNGLGGSWYACPIPLDSPLPCDARGCACAGPDAPDHFDGPWAGDASDCRRRHPGPVGTPSVWQAWCEPCDTTDGPPAGWTSEHAHYAVDSPIGSPYRAVGYGGELPGMWCIDTTSYVAPDGGAP